MLCWPKMIGSRGDISEFQDYRERIKEKFGELRSRYPGCDPDHRYFRGVFRKALEGVQFPHNYSETSNVSPKAQIAAELGSKTYPLGEPAELQADGRSIYLVALSHTPSRHRLYTSMLAESSVKVAASVSSAPNN